MRGEPCDWCGEPVLPDGGFRATEPAGERCATFCRLEHVVPWVINGAHWRAETLEHTAQELEQVERCALCAETVGETCVLLVRHRGEHRIADAFCGTAHLMEWARAGGRWA